MICDKMFIEAVSVCVNYSDYLRETLPWNLPHIDLLTIVTTPDDRETWNLCREYGVRCLKNEVFHRDVKPPSFNKSRGINHGLVHQSLRDWVLHLDADIVLPPQFRRMLENAELDSLNLYGMDRVRCIGSDEWDTYLRDIKSQRQFGYSYLIDPPHRWPLGARVVHGDYGGYVPIGFFQLWNPRASGIDRYPIKLDSEMEHSDLLFGVQWPRPNRVLLPEGFCIHLEVDKQKFGDNWNGRKTPPFRGVLPGRNHIKHEKGYH